MMDAYSVADTILGDVADASAQFLATPLRSAGGDNGGDWEGVVTTYADWKAVDAEEVARGARLGKGGGGGGGGGGARAFLAGRRVWVTTWYT
ncbi:hypothetical protein FIBSPDRAFT_966894 [Athelia psychrophila]|uniref:Uncharacterized protein n=1 Tax=Athelia psychrophila TaxID=1759441 RepID=A0A167WB84_9AGAM|nr:hypothetical protein FIBSPDRAFT_966894 [Fibularhizoctonia sp. CBS 109695]